MKVLATADLAPILQGFFTDRLSRQKNASPHTVAAYRDTCRLLLSFASQRTGKQPSQLSVADLHADLVGSFLQHLHDERGNGTTTRNARLTAIHSLFRYAAIRAPEHAVVISQVLAIPPRRHQRAIVSYLTGAETDALLTAPDRATWHGRRDHALLLLAVQTGLRVSELTGLTREEIQLGTGAHVQCHGKGRKDRATPLTLRPWPCSVQCLAEPRSWPRQPAVPDQDPVGHYPLTRSNDSSTSTPPPRPGNAPRCGRRTSPPTRSGTAARWRCCAPASTPRSSRSGPDTRTPTPPRSICTPT